MSIFKNPLVWAHRGASGSAPENTLAAFKMAAEMGADGVELDIQKTRDGVIVVCHDEKVDRTSNGSGWIKDFSFDEIRKLDFCNGNQEYEGIRIPTMEEVLDLLADTGLTINIELKTGIIFYEKIEEDILNLINKKNWQDRVIYSSFNHYSICKIKELDPEAKTGLLYADGFIDMPEYGKKLGADALHPSFYNLRYQGFSEECHKKRLDINVWTVNSTSDFMMCKQLGVNAVITNYPAKAKRIYKE